jgi:hypothetical protein
MVYSFFDKERQGNIANLHWMMLAAMWVNEAVMCDGESAL